MWCVDSVIYFSKKAFQLSQHLLLKSPTSFRYFRYHLYHILSVFLCLWPCSSILFVFLFVLITISNVRTIVIYVLKWNATLYRLFFWLSPFCVYCFVFIEVRFCVIDKQWGPTTLQIPFGGQEAETPWAMQCPRGESHSTAFLGFSLDSIYGTFPQRLWLLWKLLWCVLSEVRFFIQKRCLNRKHVPAVVQGYSPTGSFLRIPW